MLAGNFGNDGDVTWDDPELDVSGMVEVGLDPQGDLISFLAVPPQLDESPPSTAPLDGNALLTAAGLDPAGFKVAEPRWTPPVGSDQRAAWTGTYPSDPNPLRVEAASWRGKLVYFALISPWTRADRMQPAEQTLSQKVLLVVILSLLCAVVIGACLLARHNVRAGRADWRSAFRLSGFLFALGMASWALATHHMADAGELIIFMMGLNINLMVALLIWVLYVALEPYVRRRWPQTIISWTRVLNGRLRDPVVGGHLLVGIVFGVFSALATQIAALLNMHSTGVPSDVVRLDTLRGVAHVARYLIGMLPNSILNTLGVFFLLFVFRVIFRKEWLTAATFVLFFAVLGSLAHTSSALITLPIRLLQLSVMLYVMLRCGLFPYVVGASVASVLVLFPITADFSAWYAGSTIFTLVCILALTAYAFHTALAGRPLFKAGFLEE
jgi:serine/threonine-protein kinase